MTDTTSLQIKPRGTCIKTCFYREGPYLHGIVTLVKNGECEVFKGSLDLRPFAKAIARHHARLHGKTEVSGFFSSIQNAVGLGKAKLVSNISSQIKSTSATSAAHLAGATSVVFPAIGAPALAAYALAKESVGVIDQANAVKARVTQIANSGSAAAKAAAHENIDKIQKLMAQKAQVQTALARMAAKAKQGDPEALAAQRIYGIVIKQHQALKSRASTPSVARGVPAMMITRTGRVVPGHYLEQRANKKLGETVLFDGKRILRGKYAAA